MEDKLHPNAAPPNPSKTELAICPRPQIIVHLMVLYMDQSSDLDRAINGK
jgi:hypothetical protein